jgi:radical SAM superfamily enzyme YgiQ (UPF0313 family)
MKILLANPPTFKDVGSFNRPVRFPSYNYATPVLHPPLLLAYVTSYLRSKGHEVFLIDSIVEKKEVEFFLDEITRINPQFVVFETSTPSFYNDVEVATLVRSRLGATRIIFLGPHVSALPEESLTQEVIDAVVIGEYEVSLEEYISKGSNGTQGIAYRNDKGEIIKNEKRAYIENLDILPFPARDLLPNYRYFDPILKNPFTFILGGRGCPYRCAFCNWPQVLTGSKYRLRSAQNIIEEIKNISQQYKFRSMLFNDDTFTANRKHAIEVCDRLIDSKLNADWACYARADDGDEEFLRKLRHAGCYMLKIGVESGNQQILDNIKKGYDLSKVRQAISRMKKSGFQVHATFVFGLPGETQETIRETIAFAKTVSPTTVQFSSAVPFPGTEFYEILRKDKRFLTHDWSCFMPLQPIFEYENLSAKEIRRAVGTAYQKFYFRPGYFFTGVKKFFGEPRIIWSNFNRLIRFVLRK